MRELGDILEALAEVPPTGPAAVLATVVAVSGSTYRRPGARMLVLPDGHRVGLVSGGCLEDDLAERAGAVRREGRPRLVCYDATGEDDILWGLGLGCAGRVEVLLEPVDAAHPGPLAWLGGWREAHASGALATRLEGAELGRRWALHPDGRFEDPEGQNGNEDRHLRVLLEDGLRTGRSGRVAAPGGDVALEIARPPFRLVVFGAGPDARPVVQLATGLGWRVVVVDGRPAYAQPSLFPGARVHCAPAERAVATAGVERGDAALVMTHHYLHDRSLLRALLPGPATYVGLLGPRQRALDLLEDLARAGCHPSPEQLARFHAPAGLDLGGEGPEAIALSLVAELQAVHEGRRGGWLRDRKGPIHETAPA